MMLFFRSRLCTAGLIILSLARGVFVGAEENQIGFRIVDFEESENTIIAAVWYPTDEECESYRYGGILETNRVALDAQVKGNAKGWPLLAWSHGYGGGGIGSVFLAEALAAKGWVVAAPDHSDRDRTVRIRTGPQKVDGRE